MRVFLFLGALFVAVDGFDVIRGLFKDVDFYRHPCEDFYRHACPQSDDGSFALSREYRGILRKIEAKQENNIWENLEIKEFIDNALIREIPYGHILIPDIFYTRCNEDLNNEKFLQMIQETAFGTSDDGSCFGNCLSFLNFDRNCTRAANELEKRLSPEYSLVSWRNFASFVEPVKKQMRILRRNIHGANAIIDGDLEKGIEIVDDLVNRIVVKVTEWIKKTPWVINNQLVESITEIINTVHLNKNYAMVLRDQLESLLSLEHSFLECLAKLGNGVNHKNFCMIYASEKMVPISESIHFFNNYNAHIAHPIVEVSFFQYHMAQHVEEFVAVLGSVGFVIGHEVGHTLIENATRPEILQQFSNNSMHCIQDQFQKTCDAFRETSCHILAEQLDDNGADILGFQLAYAIFEELYSDRLQEEYIQVNGKSITLQKLFFYAYAFNGCDTRKSQLWDLRHSAPNARVNVIAQHPAFQETFKCSSDSKMMSSATEQCILYGEGAPETKKKYEANKKKQPSANSVNYSNLK